MPTGTLAITELSDSAAVAGYLAVSVSTWVDGDDWRDSDTWQSSPDTATGTLSATEPTGLDTASLEGAVARSGSLAATETGADVASISGQGIISVNIWDDTRTWDDNNIWEDQETTATGSLAGVETGSDICLMSSQPLASGTMALTETSDTASFAGSSTVTGAMALTEDADTIYVLYGSLPKTLSVTFTSKAPSISATN